MQVSKKERERENAHPAAREQILIYNNKKI